MIKVHLILENIAIFRFVEEHENPVSAVLEEGVYCEKSPLFQVRGQIWEALSSQGSWRSQKTTSSILLQYDPTEMK